MLIFPVPIPPRRKAIDYYNPIPNLMGKKYPWMPGPEYYIDFQHGDPYTKVKMGEMRLPGPGYEALHGLHSGTQGVYDPVDAFMILADVAPYSDQYKEYRKIVGGMSRRGELTPEWQERYQQKLKQIYLINAILVFPEPQITSPSSQPSHLPLPYTTKLYQIFSFLFNTFFTCSSVTGYY